MEFECDDPRAAFRHLETASVRTPLCVALRAASEVKAACNCIAPGEQNTVARSSIAHNRHRDTFILLQRPMPPIVNAKGSSLRDADTQHNLAHTLSTRSVAPHTAVFLGIAAVVVAVVLTVSLFAFYLYWKQKRERLEKLQRKAIRHMTLVGPVESPYGPFGTTGESSFFRASYDSVRPSIEQNVPATPPPTYSHPRDRIFPKVVINSDESLTSTMTNKRIYSAGGDRMILVNGVYVVALDSDGVRE